MEITAKKKQELLHREETSLASEKKTEDKSTQTISRRVWRKIKKKELLRQQNGIEATSQASSNSRSCSNAEIFGRTARISERSRAGIQRTRRKLKKQEEAQVEALKEEQKKLTTAWKDFQDKKDTQEKELFSQSEEMTRREEALEELEGKMKTREENVRLKEEMAEENLADIDGRKTEMEKLQDRLDARDSDLTKKETDITVRERQITVKNEAIKKKANEITKKADELKVEEARIEAMKKELPTGPVPEGKEGMEATIILQQKQLLEKCMDQNEKTDKLIARQLKLEEDRVEREKERDKKEEESLATGKGFKPPSFKGIEGEKTRSSYSQSRRLDGSFKSKDER